MSYILGGDAYSTGSSALGCSPQSSITLADGTITCNNLQVGEKRYQIVGFTLLVLDTRLEVPNSVKNRVIWMSGILTDLVEYGKAIDKTNYILRYAEDINKAKSQWSTKDLQIELQEQFRYEVKR